MATKTEAKTLIDALNNERGRDLVDAIEDMVASGSERFAKEIQATIRELFETTGYRYEV